MISTTVTQVTAMPSHPAIRAEFLDFRDRSHGDLALDEIPEQREAGRFIWVDIDLPAVEPANLQALLPSCVLESDSVSQILAEGCHGAAAESPTVSTLTRTDDAIRICLVGVRQQESGLSSEQLDIVIGEGLLTTVRHGHSGVLQAVRRDYISDFERHAATPSFLIYEFWDKQIDQFLSAQGRLDEEVEAIRLALRRSADEATLTRLADVSSQLLALRKRVLPARRVLEELVSRKTTLISEATLDFLGKMIDTLERLLADITANREILESAMNFSLTVMTHRTNLTMNRLAVVSTIFLPLTFLCGVYGMNFEVMPELEWRHSYAMFWVVSAIITVTLTIVLKRARLL
jgi:magnesium transporter